jgi:hypothetical protein
MHSCCCIYFILWCGLYFIWFGFETIFKRFWKQIEKKREKDNLPLCSRPGLVSLPLPLLGRRAKAAAPFLLSTRMGRPRYRGCAPLLSLVADGWDPFVSRLFYLITWTNRTLTRFLPNPTRFSRDLLTNYGILVAIRAMPRPPSPPFPSKDQVLSCEIELVSWKN